MSTDGPSTGGWPHDNSCLRLFDVPGLTKWIYSLHRKRACHSGNAMSELHVLCQVPVLAGLSSEQLEVVISTGEVLTFKHGEIIFEEGSTGRDWYIVLEGVVDIMVDPAALARMERGSTDLTSVDRLERGGSFGELALIDRRPRSASAICAEDGTRVLM